MCYAITVPPPQSTPKTITNQQDKRSLLIGDLSYSYAATDIGSPEGSHIKTITVIKNVAVPKSAKIFSQHVGSEEWQKQVKNQFKIVMKLPDFPEIPPANFFTGDLKLNTKASTTTIQLNDEKRPPSTTHTEKLLLHKNVSEKKLSNDEDVVQGHYEDATSYESQGQHDMEQHILKMDAKHRKSESLPEAMSLQQQKQSDHMVKQEDRSQMDVEKTFEKISKDVEFIQNVENTEIQPEAAERSKEAQSRRNKEVNQNKYKAAAAVQPLELTNSQKSLEKSSAIVEDFSDYSMHTVKHIVDPIKASKQSQAITKFKVQFTTQNKKDTPQEVPVSQQQTDSLRKYRLNNYGSKIENTAQVTLDSGQNKKIAYAAPYLRELPRKAYHSPSVDNAYSTSSTTTQEPYLAPVKSRAPQTFYLLHPPSTTTQTPYLSPNVYKSYSLNKEQIQLEQRQLQAERDELEQQQLEFERQQLQQKQSSPQKKYEDIDEPADLKHSAHAEPLQRLRVDESESLKEDYTAPKKSEPIIDSRQKEMAQLRQGKQYSERLKRPHELFDDEDDYFRTKKQTNQNIKNDDQIEIIIGKPKTQSRVQSPVQHQKQQTPIKSSKQSSTSSRRKPQTFIAVPIDISTQSPYFKDKKYQSYKIPPHLERHPLVFDSEPTHEFLKSPFRSSIKLPSFRKK